MPVRPAFCGLLYGPHPELHARLLNSFANHIPGLDRAGGPSIRIWSNQVPEQTLALIESHRRRAPRAWWHMISPIWNTPKYKAMAYMFEHLPEHTTHVIWFDDDSFIQVDDFWFRFSAFLENPNVVYAGATHFLPMSPADQRIIKASHWYRHRPFETARGIKIFRFIEGGFWALRTDVLRKLRWPDRRLSHNGGDVLLGEAVRQLNYPMHEWLYGVAINQAPRRGLSEKPLVGCHHVPVAEHQPIR